MAQEQFSAFYDRLQRFEGHVPMPLMAPWDARSRNLMGDILRVACAASENLQAQIPHFGGTNQSKGNQCETFFLAQVAQHLPQHAHFARPPERGYPDQILSIHGEGFCFEVKASSEWNGNDTLRCVLTGSTTRLRASIAQGLVTNPPRHAVCYLIYDDAQSRISNVRLDFLGPDFPVAYKLEASTSKRGLDQYGQFVLI